MARTLPLPAPASLHVWRGAQMEDILLGHLLRHGYVQDLVHCSARSPRPSMGPTENQTEKGSWGLGLLPAPSSSGECRLESQCVEASCPFCCRLDKSLVHSLCVPFDTWLGEPDLRGSAECFEKGWGPSQSLLSSKRRRILQVGVSSGDSPPLG